MRTLLRHTALVLFVLTAAAGCGRLARSAFQPPLVGLQDVVIKGLGTEGGSLDIILDVENKNDYRIDATRVTYTVYADSGRIASGEVNKLVTLPKKDRNVIVLPVTVTYKELLSAAGALMRRGGVDYRIVGEVTVATPFGKITRPYAGNGRFDSLRP
ncbi:MAG: LEA type 2 family protein [Gemmatimonadaceae bacterium]|nr:LEA type 2 family protein [Gemmatimonadaceae bacterium]